MGLWLLCNTASDEAADFRITDTSDVELSAGESEGLDNLRGGHRGLKFRYDVADASRFVYTRNAGGGITTPTHVVIADSAVALGPDKDLSLLEWEDYPGSFGTVASYTGFEETLIGIDGRDWVGAWDSILIGNPESVGIQLDGGTAADMGKLYICAGQEFRFRAGSLVFTKVPVWAEAVRCAGNWFKLYGQAKFGVIGLSRANVADYLALPKNDAVFFYDDTGGDDYGDFLPHKLWHSVILEDVVTQYFDDFYGIDFSIGILKAGNG